MSNPECKPPEAPVFPLPLSTVTDCEPGEKAAVPEYEKGYILERSKRLIPPLTLRAMRYFKGRTDASAALVAAGAGLAQIQAKSAGMLGLHDELASIVAINPPDFVLADYRALRLRVFFTALLRIFVNSVLDPTGQVTASRLITSDGRVAGGTKFDDMTKFGVACLVDGSDKAIRDGCNIFLDAMGEK